jgi:carboxylesterase type B
MLISLCAWKINLATGNFTNISPVPWLGAFHWSDLMMIFGTYMLDKGDITKLEVETSEIMQDFLLSFLKDSTTVNTTVGWPAFDPNAANGGLIIEFGKGTAVKNITGDWLDAGCSDPSIPFRING